jgi:hypothetical protein
MHAELFVCEYAALNTTAGMLCTVMQDAAVMKGHREGAGDTAHTTALQLQLASTW